MRERAARTLTAFLALTTAACGYRWMAPGAGLPGGLRSVCAATFANATPEPNAELIFDVELLGVG